MQENRGQEKNKIFKQWLIINVESANLCNKVLHEIFEQAYKGWTNKSSVTPANCGNKIQGEIQFINCGGTQVYFI